MPVYLDVLMLLNFLVDLLLLIGTNRLSGYAANIKRTVPAAILGGIYGGICILPELQFLSHTCWRVAVLGVMAGIAFGFSKNALRRGILFVLLSMALGGIATGLADGGFWALSLSALAVCGMCLYGFRGRVGAEYLSVELEGLRLTALKDTGNTLTDPLTGQRILIVSAQVAEQLLKLDAKDLEDPVQAVMRVQGARLIPYQAVGKRSMLLAKRFDNVTIGKWNGSCLVAFAPGNIGQSGEYEALTGGVL